MTNDRAPNPAPAELDVSTAPASSLQNFPPAYFAFVMATGIVSIAAHLTGIEWLALSLFWVNLPAYAILWILTLIRFLRFRSAFLADLSDHARGVGFFTMIAGTCVLGSQCIILFNAIAAGMVLGCIGVFLWLVLTYSIFTLLTVKHDKPPLNLGINGGWLVTVVATQAISILGSQLASHVGSYIEPLLFFALVMWLGGGMLYIWLISLIFYRYTFLPMEPGDLAPPYWINMGAVAISTLAGTFLIGQQAHSPLLASLMPFLKGMTLLFWATATWWIPMLVTLGVWRHLYRRFPVRYDPLYWGAVFPLGMYTACTYRLAASVDTPFLRTIAEYFIYVAVAAWSAVFLGLLHHLWNRRFSHNQ